MSKEYVAGKLRTPQEMLQRELDQRTLEVEALIVVMSILRDKLLDQFFRADPIKLIDMAAREINRAMEASPTYRRVSVRLHVRKPDPNEEDV